MPSASTTSAPVSPDYIGNFYNAERRHSHLGYLSRMASNCHHEFNAP